MAKTSWRFEFVDINKSITINEAEADFTGYAVIRAPKGSTQAMYIPPNNRAMIESMFGYASADWPDLYEVIDFNSQYGVYVSAPTVDTVECPNYYGGVYLTKHGLINMYNVTDKVHPNFEAGLVPGSESLSIPTAGNSTIQISDLVGTNTDQMSITIGDIDADVFRNLKYIDLDWNGAKPFRYKLDRTNQYILPDASSVTDADALNIVCGTYSMNVDTGKYTICLGNILSGVNVVGGLNTVEHEKSYGIPFISKFSSYEPFIGDDFDSWKTGANGVAFRNAIIDGGVVRNEDGSVNRFDKPLSKAVTLVYDISDDVYSYHVQPSPTANRCTITFNDVVYDKYNYSMKVCYSNGTGANLPTEPTSLAKALTSSGYLAIAKASSSDNLKLFEYQEVEDEDTGIITGKWVDVTNDYITDSILAFEPISGTTVSDIHHKIYRVTESGLKEMTVDAKDEDLKLTENVLFNSYFSKAVETDSTGELHTSGAFVGSLDEFGTDINGTDNYWEELIPPGDSVVFAETYVVRTFEDELDAHGVYTGVRLDGETSKIVSGQRYVDYVVSKNISEGCTGGECTSASASIQKKFAKIVKEGLIEATKPKYEDCSIFMEFTGLDSLKSYLGGIRTAHYTATIITPKNITSIANCKTISVAGRYRGTAQYCQELQYKDKNLRKKYYACPIGATAAMLVKIMQQYYGGVAPMWINEGGVGGQIADFLQRNPIKARWDFTDEDTKILDQKGINPILVDEEDGVMITSHRTTEQNAGDWSYLGHSMSFDLCKREIRDKVMKPQIGKKISPHWISKRQLQTDNILAKRTSGHDPIWSYAKADIASANTAYTKAQRIFCIPVEVRVSPFSEIVRLTFTNLSQTSVVSD